MEQWAEIRRLYLVKRLSIKEIVRRTGRGRNTIRRALRSAEAPHYRRPPRPSKLDPFREEIHQLLRSDPRLPGKRMRELLEKQGLPGWQDDPGRLPARAAAALPAAAAHLPAHLLSAGRSASFDLWEPGREIPVGAGRRPRLRRDRLPYSRVGAGALMFSIRCSRSGACFEAVCSCGWAVCRRRSSGTARGRCMPAAAIRATRSPPSAASSGSAGGSSRRAIPSPRASSSGCRATPRRASSRRAAASWASSTSRSNSTAGFEQRANLRFHRTLRCRPVDRLAEELTVMRPLPETMPNVDRRLVTRIAPDPYVRVDSNDYSLDDRVAVGVYGQTSEWR